MLTLPTAAKRVLLGIEPKEVRVDARGFHVDNPEARARIEAVGRAFVYGYEAALVARQTEDLVGALLLVDNENRGFSFEGAGMALALRDALSLRRSRSWPQFAVGAGSPHVYMVHVGAGWAFARLPRGRRRLEAFLSRTDPLLRWLAVDGYGFHHGFFGSRRTLAGHRPRFDDDYGARAFDQGFGRSLWFVEGMDVRRVARRMETFAPNRHSDLWSGVGLALAYAGGCSLAQLELIPRLAGPSLAQVQQGIAFAATARMRAGNMAPHTEMACRALCDASADELARRTETIHHDLGPEPAPSDYEAWRARVGASCAGLRA
jgi:enediyne biosynthesis protein E3